MERKSIVSEKKEIVPISKKYALTVEQMSEYTNIGVKKIYQILDENPYEEFILRIGNKRLLKRRLFENYLDRTCTI